MKNNYCVYIHLNKINNKAYIGLTGQNPEKRWINGTHYKTCTHFNRAARKMGYDEGYEAAKAYYNKPNWWYWTNTTTPAVINTPYITCTSDSNNSNLTSTTTIATTINNSDDFVKSYTFECKIDPKKSQEAINKIIGNNNVKIREFKFNGTER